MVVRLWIFVTALAAGFALGLPAAAQQWTAPLPTAPPAAAPPVYTAPIAPPMVGSPDLYSPTPAAAVPFGSPVAPYVSAGVPPMPPPPANLAPPSLRGFSPVIAMQPPVSMPPPVAQGFGATIPPAALPPALPPDAYATVPGGLPPGAVIAAPPPGAPVSMFDPNEYVRFMQSVRLRYTYLWGDSDPNEFGISDIEAAITFAYPDFLGSQQPLLITPGFILSLWDPPSIGTPNPAPPPNKNFPPGIQGELPSQVYAAYLDFYWAPRLSQTFSAELDFRIGIYSDFESVGSEALRPQAYGALIYQMSPAWALKGGAAYINRVEIEVLPVFGAIWTPNPYMYWDLTFPNPKLSQYAWTWGNTDVWWYLAAEYGGGTWEIDNASDDRVDIDDIRLIAGLEWTGGYFGLRGFLELGYVFDREVVFASSNFKLKPDDTFMIRGGVAF